MQKRIKKPKILQNVTIEKLGYSGVGIWRLPDGKKILVHGGVLPWSIIDVIVTKTKKDFFEGRVFFIHKIAEEYGTMEAPCPHYFGFGSKDTTSINEHAIWCGGCKRQQVDYAKQLKLKQEMIADTFRSVRKELETAEIRDILPAPEHRWYRNKIEYSFGDYKRGEVHNTRALGFHKQWQFSQIIDINECLLVSAESRKLFSYVKKICVDSWLPTHNQIHHTWFFRHLMIREWKNTGQFLLNLSISDNTLTSDQQTQRESLQAILKDDEYLKNTVTSFIISINNGLGDSIYNRDTKQTILWWDDFIFEKLRFSLRGIQSDVVEANNMEWTTTYGEENKNSWEQKIIDVPCRVSTNSFFQTNTLGAQLLFGTAVQFLGEVHWPLIDLYCGTGSIGIACNKLGIGDSLYGIEIVPEAIIDAQYNAKINWIENAYFLAWKAEDLLHSDATFAQACEQTECIIVDPPRDGLHKNVISFLIEQRKNHPFKLLYISCNPVTLARDIALLSVVFSAKILQPVDMFPHTHHIETICLLW